MTEQELERIKLKHLKGNIQLYNENIELLLLYNQYIEKIVEFFDFIKANENEFLYTIIFDILMESGFFSYNNKFDFQKESFKELPIKPGLSIINGEGVCRNVSCFYEDISSYFFNYPLKICCYDLTGEQSKETKLFGNHVINLTSYQDVIYGFDIINQCVFKIISDNSLQGFNFNHTLTYAPGGDLLLYLITNIDIGNDFNDVINEKYNILSKASVKKVMSNSEYQELIKKANMFIIERKPLFKSFSLKNKDLTHRIKQKMLLLK